MTRARHDPRARESDSPNQATEKPPSWPPPPARKLDCPRPRVAADPSKSREVFRRSDRGCRWTKPRTVRDTGPHEPAITHAGFPPTPVVVPTPRDAQSIFRPPTSRFVPGAERSAEGEGPPRSSHHVVGRGRQTCSAGRTARRRTSASGPREPAVSGRRSTVTVVSHPPSMRPPAHGSCSDVARRLAARPLRPDRFTLNHGTSRRAPVPRMVIDA